MSSSNYHPWLHRFAVLTAAVSLLPIVIGALVTTFDAGMAFPDWPSSDGQNMFLYPWLKSAGDKFLEHGHRLAGSLIGFVSIALVVLVFKTENRKWVKGLAVAILLCVIFQGILGGARVLADQRGMALIHSAFAAVVFTMICSLILFTGKSWVDFQDDKQDDRYEPVSFIKPISTLLPIVVFGQYIVGGMLRHLGRSVNEHIVLAIMVFVLSVVLNFQTRQTGNRWLVRSANWILFVVFCQIGLGLGAFATRFGIQTIGYVAVQHSPIQVTFRSVHTIVGMTLLMASVIHMIRVYRVGWSRKKESLTDQISQSISSSDSLSVNGGLS